VCYLVSNVSAAVQDRTQYRLGAEHDLYSHGGPGHRVGDHGLAPQRELVPGRADKVIGCQPQHRHAPVGSLRSGLLPPGSLRSRLLPPGSLWPSWHWPGRYRPPAVELPAHPVGDAGRGQQPVVPP